MSDKLSKFAEFWMEPSEVQNYYNTMEDQEVKRHAREILEKARQDVGPAIDRFNAASSSIASASTLPGDAWATMPRKDIQGAAEGQVLREMYGKNPLGLARELGITSNPSDEAKQFVSGLEKESDLKQKGDNTALRFKAQMEKDTPETKSRAMDLLDQFQVSGQYPNVNWEAWKNRITDTYDGAYQFNKIFTAGQTSTDEAVRKENLIRPAKAQTSAATAQATIPAQTEAASATTTAREQAQRDIQKTNPMLSGENAVKVSQSALAIKNLQRLRNALKSGNIQYFDIIRKTGQFSDPSVNNAYQQVSEIVGRQQSGAAISNSEWKNFGKEILNKNFLLTEEGRKTALENLDDYLERFHSTGTLITSDEDWYNSYRSRAKKSMGVEGSDSGGFTEEKRRRLEELRAKKAAGTLGK